MEYETKKKSPPLTDVKPIKSKVIGKISSSSMASDKIVAPPTKTTILAPPKRLQQPPVKRKYVEERDIVTSLEPIVETKSSSTGTGKSILKTPVSSAKKIRVIAENDMIGPKLPPPKKTVFERLGAENDLPQVSSTTEISKPDVATTFTRTFKNVVLPASTSSADIDYADDDESPRLKMSSVFDRLGGLKDILPKREMKGPELQYAGVFKSPRNKPTSKPVLKILKKVGTMRADEPEIPVKLRAARPKLSYANDRSVKVRLGESSVKSRLEPLHRLNTTRPIKTKEPSAGIFANPYKTKTLSVTSRLAIKDRLGLQSRFGAKSLTTSKRLKRDFPATGKLRSSCTDEEDEGDSYVFPSRVELMESKKVSFGRVEQKMITPVKQLKNSRLHGDSMKSRIGVHSRLGTPNFI